MNEEQLKLEIQKALAWEEPYDNGGFIHSGIVLYIQNHLKEFGNKGDIYDILNSFINHTERNEGSVMFPCEADEVIFLAREYIEKRNKV